MPHVHYDLLKKEGKIVTKCKLVNNKDYSIVDSLDISVWCERTNKHFIEFAKNINPDLFYKTIVIDYLCSNIDRHSGNWGFFMNNKTGELLDIHPLFDHNNTFDGKDMTGEQIIECQLLPGKSLKDAAYYAIKHCDFRCIKPITRDMFFNDIAYESFMNRATELGLYKKRKISFFEKITNRHPNEFIPIELKVDNTSEYWENINKKLTQQNSIITTIKKDKPSKIIKKNIVQKKYRIRKS